MDMKKTIFMARVSGQPIELKKCFRKKSRTEQVIAPWKHDVIKWDILSRGENGAIFNMIDSVSISGLELAKGQRVLFDSLDLIKLLEFRLVKEQI